MVVDSDMDISGHIIKRLKDTVDDFEIYISRGRSLSIEVKDDKVDSFDASRSEGVGLRVLKGRRMGFSYTSAFTMDSIDGLIDGAVQGSIYSEEDRDASLPEKRQVKAEGLHIYDPYLIHIPEKDKIEVAIAVERAARAYDQRVKRTRKAYYKEYVKEVEIIGREIYLSSISTRVTSGILAIAEEDGDSQMGWDSDSSRYFREIRPDEIGTRAGERAVRLLKAREGFTAKVPVVFENSVTAELLEVLAASFLGDNLYKGKSMLKDRLGKEVFSSKITIVDDGRLKGGWSTQPFDDEGIETRKTPLVDKGVLVGYLYDHYWAGKVGRKSTGNGYRRGFKTPPGVSYTNLYIENGAKTPQALIKGIDRGFLITDLLGVHTANPVTGDFSFGAMGFLIEGGSLSYPVKGIAIAGNMLELFKRVIDVGNDQRFFGGIGAPSILIESLDISGG